MISKNFFELIKSGNLSKIKQIKEISTYANAPLIGDYDTGNFFFVNPSPLQVASYYGQIEIVSYLLRLGSDPNYIGQNDMTALQIAITQNNVPLIKLLLENGACINIDDAFNVPTIYLVIRHASLEILSAFLEKDDFKSLSYKGNNLLQFAVQMGKEEQAMLLIAHGYSPEDKNKKGKSAFEIAKEKNMEKLLKRMTNTEEIENILAKERKEIEKMEESEKKRDVGTIDEKEYEYLQKRLSAIEEVVHHLLPEYGNISKIFNPPPCCKCRNKLGKNVCPVCGKYFCDSHFYTHVANGCKKIE